MIYYLKAFAMWVVTLAVLYLAGAFIAADWNISAWRGLGRFFIACVGLIAGGMFFESAYDIHVKASGQRRRGA